jgi:dUTP pyrophosphatase
MKVKVKKLHPNAQVPKYAKNGDAGLDLTAVTADHFESYSEYDTGLSIEIPSGYVGLVFPRSSVTEKDLILKNSVGVIDSSYRGSVKFRFMRLARGPANFYNIGERIGQLIIIPYPQIELEESEELSNSERGDGGFGSTGQ